MPDTPEEKAKILGVPLIPLQTHKDKKKPTFSNTTTGICRECGLEIKERMFYKCKNNNCPIFLS